MEVAQQHLVQHCPCLIRVTNILERLGRVPAGLFEQDFVASWVLFRQSRLACCDSIHVNA